MWVVIDNYMSKMTQPHTSDHPSPKLRNAELIFERKGIDFDAWLLEQRKTKSLEQISRDIYVETDLEVAVTTQTVRRYLDWLEATS